MEKINRTSILSGALVAVGVIVNLSAGNKYIGSMLFSLALLTIIHCGLQLYTGRIGFAINGRHSFLTYVEMILLNFLGSLAFYIWYICQGDEIHQTVLDISTTKFAHSYLYLFVCGFFCGVLMFVAVSCKNTIITVFCIMTFILSGFEHCIADFPYFIAGTMSVDKLFKFLLIIAGNSAGSIVTNILSTQHASDEATGKKAAHRAAKHTGKRGARDNMKFRTVHENYNVSDLDRSLDFYREALGLTEHRRKVAKDGSYIIVFIGNDEATFEMELTWLRDHHGSYNLGENEFHLGFKTDDYEASHAKHEEMGCICYENPEMGIYFISDPDGYWLEIIPERD